MNFKYDLKQKVLITISKEIGQIIARAEYFDSASMYEVEYKSTDGKAKVDWFYERAIEAIDPTYETKVKAMIPEIYQHAEWRNTTPMDEYTHSRIGIGFDLSTGEIIRLSISAKTARYLIETLRQSLSIDHASP